MHGSESTASALAGRLTNDGVASARPTSQASLAANMAREARVYDYILEVGVSIGIQS